MLNTNYKPLFMKNQFLILLIAGFASFFGAAFPASAQIKTPAASPLSTLTQEIGLMEVKITYSRPSAKGREIFGELVPYGKSWRTGANASTKISFTDAVTIEGKSVPAGEYALFTIPGEKEWTIILHKDANLMGTGGENYKQGDEAARFTVKSTKVSEPVETFTFAVGDITLNSGVVSILWENTEVSFKVAADFDSKIMANIEQSIKNIERNNGNLYHQGAWYYVETGKDLNQALEWVNKAVAVNPDAYWMSYTKARILAGLNNKKAAIEAAEVSKKAAEKGNNQDYVRLNDKLIAEMKKK